MSQNCKPGIVAVKELMCPQEPTLHLKREERSAE